MSAPGRVRIRKARRASRLACGHFVQVGALIVSHNKRRWTCIDCAVARIRVAGQARRRGAWTVGEVLEDEAQRL
jgi:hypothetical protein